MIVKRVCFWQVLTLFMQKEEEKRKKESRVLKILLYLTVENVCFVFWWESGFGIPSLCLMQIFYYTIYPSFFNIMNKIGNLKKDSEGFAR